MLTCLGNYYSHVFKDLAQSHFELTSSNYSAEMSMNPICPKPEQLLTHLLLPSLCLCYTKKKSWGGENKFKLIPRLREKKSRTNTERQ